MRRMYKPVNTSNTVVPGPQQGITFRELSIKSKWKYDDIRVFIEWMEDHYSKNFPTKLRCDVQLLEIVRRNNPGLPIGALILDTEWTKALTEPMKDYQDYLKAQDVLKDVTIQTGVDLNC